MNIYALPFLLCTWFGLGKLKPAPGTWGSAGALPFAWALQVYGGPWAVAIAAATIALISLWAIRLFLVRWPGDDPGEIVIDEVAGMWLTLIFVPADPVFYLAAFAVFRFFDTTKIWPASWADRTLDGAPGVLIDDLFAGVYGMLVMLAVVYFW
ncbi:MAG: phosphatidylglycerophosphatase A [Ferrovibrio sp.]|uniref:phosphatidylglycerophosphatase A family protein n=1 Tax=Ferrovibrio sp. TaxID=1917215 RepID=UPI00260F93F6|nr:phosphatidylglycerophosphatase A [Ferrovibrio sp.]MCW0232211.1 phosphatidylglycerophosphatase A [Ferrovibrio sp.]